MRKHALIALAAAATIALPLTACGGQPVASGNGGSSEPAATTSESEGFDAVDAYWGQWRGSVEITGQTVYGTAGGSEPMLDVNLAQDGTCTVEPLEAHADLLTDEGTWEGTEDAITLHLSSGDITLTVTGSAKCEGNAADFGIADFDTINFDFYG